MSQENNNTDQPTDDSATPNDQEARLFRIEPSRYVIVRPEGPQRLTAVDGGWEELCQVQPGDRVIYEGTPTIVKAVEVY